MLNVMSINEARAPSNCLNIRVIHQIYPSDFVGTIGTKK